jgi:YVTN family beta-propeller protein
MIKQIASALVSTLALLTLAGCGSGGGGGGGGATVTQTEDGPESTLSDLLIQTFATVAADGTFARVDLVDGGTPVTDASDPFDPGALPPNPAKRAFLSKLITTSGVDLDANMSDSNGDGIGDTGFDTYETGMAHGTLAARILGANNLYDLFQTTTGMPLLFNGLGGGPPFSGGDADGDGVLDGGPGLFSNMSGEQLGFNGPFVTSLVPKLPTLPNAMGLIGRGPSASDQHQFIQVEFPYLLDVPSLFNPFNAGNSYLGDQTPGPLNFFVQERHVERSAPGDTLNIVDQLPAHVTVVAVIGGVASIPTLGGTDFAVIADDSKDHTAATNSSNIPEGARRLIGRKNVLTLIAHESPTGIAGAPIGTPSGHVDGTGTLILPDPTADAGGGRVFGGNLGGHPGSVNDFATDGDQTAARVGFVSVLIKDLRTNGQTVADPYFHTFPMSQDNVGADSLAVLAKPQGTELTFNRGPAIAVDSVTEIPSIDVLEPALDYIPPFSSVPASDAVNVVSTRARFRIDFDKEVVPNSVGFSRRYTIHSTASKGIVFPFNGNSRPTESPAVSFVTTALGSPLAPSVYLAINQPKTGANPTTERRVNNPIAKAGSLFKDDGSLIDPSAVTIPQINDINGLYPARFNTLATLPRGVVPCDIYPVNQNNLQAYVIEPLVELPPGVVVTVGVCRPGLGTSNNTLNATMSLDPLALNAIPFQPTNHGNYTRNGTMYTPYQGLTPVGLGDNTISSKQAVIGNDTIIKVNAGPMDLEGNLFFGGTTVALDVLIDGDPSGNGSNDLTTGFFNVSRTFPVGTDATEPYVNMPVAPQAVAVGFAGGKGLGVLDLSGTGFNTNAPGGGFEDLAIVSRYLQPNASGQPTLFNWSNGGSLSQGNHERAFGITTRYTSPCLCPGAISIESEFAVSSAVATGFGTPTPGINEGSSGFETMGRNSFGSEFLSDPADVKGVRDILVGDFLDTVFFDTDNPFATSSGHRTFNTPTQTGVTNNVVSDPPLPNPPPLRFPVGLNHTNVRFDQDDLSKAPFLIDGNEVFNADSFMTLNDGTGIPVGSRAPQGFVQQVPSYNQSNPNSFDIPPLPQAGFPSPFAEDNGQQVKFVQTGPLPETSTTGAVLLSFQNQQAINSADQTGLVSPIYESRQQIGNFLFVTDGVSKELHAVNSNNMKVIESLKLPDPYGLAMTPDLELLYVSNEGDNTVSVIDADPRRASFMTELKRIDVGQGPRGIAVSPDKEDVFVLNRLGNTISIIDVPTNSVRLTITQSGINRPEDVCMGLREVAGGPAFQSGTFHGFIANTGGDNILIYEGGPSGQAGIGFDNIIGSLKPNQPATIGQPILLGMDNPRGIVYDPITPLDAFAGTIGAFVAHQDPVSGKALVSRIAYTKDSSPGQNVFNSNVAAPGFGEKVFEITQQYESSSTGAAFDVALIDYKREQLFDSNFGTNFNLYNAGATLVIISGLNLPRNAKYPQAGASQGGILGSIARWEPDRLYLSSGGKRIDVFDLDSSQHLKTVPTAADVTVMAAYFEQ